MMNGEYLGEERRKGPQPNNGVVIPIWVASALLGVLLLGGGTMMRNLIDNSKQLAVLSFKITSMMDRLDDTADDRYRAADAQADFRLRDNQIDTIWRTIDDIKDDNEKMWAEVRKNEKKK